MWRGRTDVILGSSGCAYIGESVSLDRCLKMGAPWTTEDRAVLLRAISKYGCRWSLIASLNLIPGRSAKALRNEHSRLGHSLSTPPPLSTASCVYDVDASTTWPSLTQSRYTRRPWPYYVRAPSIFRQPTSSQLTLVHRLQLHNAGEHSLLLCDLKRARELVRGLREPIVSTSTRDRLRLVHYPSDPGLTLTSDHSTHLWLGGSAAGAGRFLSSSEVASFMGIDTRGGVYGVARRLLKERALLRALCESVPRCMAICAARLGARLLGHPTLYTVGSLYSGAFDALGAACQEVFHARLSFVAESIEVKASILHSRSPSHCFPSVEDVDASYPADILVASPPCLLYSKANRHSTYAEKMAEATRVVGELRRILDLLRPRLLVLEQTSSLVTHCPAAYQLYLGMCQDLPYTVLPYVVDAHRDCGGSHHRERLILLSVAT